MHRRLLGSGTDLPYNGNNNSNMSNRTADFDTNMVILLAALLCAFTCALGLNSIVRCAMRCSHRFALETPEQAAARLAATGLKKSHLKQIPVAVYGEEEKEGIHIPATATECPICLGEFEDGDKIRVLPKCNHGFHVRCIDTWLVSHSSCPNCRHSLLEHQQPSKTRTTSNNSIDSEAAGHSSPASSTGSGSNSNQEARVVVVIDEAVDSEVSKKHSDTSKREEDNGG